MPRIVSALVSSMLLFGSACTSPAKATTENPTSSSDTAKLSAPVKVHALLAEDQAVVTVRADAAASDVTINIRGIDGVEVANAGNLVEGASFEQGAERTFEVPFTGTTGHLVVSVTGAFRGSKMAKVSTFAVGKPEQPRRLEAPKAETGTDGERIKVMPSGD